VLVAVPSCLVWLAGGASADRMLQSERAAKRFNLVMAALLAGSVLLFLA
jgi:threonine/homoserine/homoserine lactone efflux protein